MMPPRRIFVLLALLCCCIAKTQGISCVVASQTAEPAAICLPSPRLRLRLVGGCADESRRDEEDQHKLATPSNGGHGLPEEAGVGLGIARSKDGHCFVARILQGSSAAESGEVEVKDRIIEVDGHAVKELSPADIGRLLKGKEGSEVEMIVEKRSGAVHCVNLVRRNVKKTPAKQQNPESTAADTRADKKVSFGFGLSRNDQHQCVVSKILPGGRVEKSRGVQVGDILVSIDGMKVERMTLKNISSYLHGTESETVNMVLNRNGKFIKAVIPPAMLSRQNEGVTRNEITSPSSTHGFAPPSTPSTARSPPKTSEAQTRSTSSALFNPLVKFLFSSSKEVVNIGLQAQKNVHGDFMVTSIEDGSPAANSGRIALGDVIAQVDGHVVKYLTWDSLANLLSGAPGSSLSITFCRWVPGESQSEGKWATFEVNLRRQRSQGATSKRSKATMISKEAQLYVDEGHLAQLVEMGFAEETARQALMATHNDIESAITWIGLNENKVNKFHEYREISMLTTAEAAAIEEEGGRVQLLGKGTNPVEQLMSLGFSRPEVEKALRKTQGRVMMAADRLLEKQSIMERKKEENEKKGKVQAKQGGFFASLLGFGSKETIA